MQRKVILFLVLFLLSFMFFAPETALSAAREGLLLWFRTLLPSLLPFMILSNFLISFNCIEKLLSPLRKIWAVLFGLSPCGAYVLLLGTLCGYPMGAKLTATCADRDRSRTGKARYLLTFASSASPMFLCTYLVLECLGTKTLLVPVLFILYLSTYLCSVCFRITTGSDSPPKTGALHKKRRHLPHTRGYAD